VGETVKFKGQAFELGGTTYTVPPIALGALRELLPRIKQIDIAAGVPAGDDLELLLDVVHAALVRNYPDLTKAQLADVVDMGNVFPLFRCVMGQSGLEPANPQTAPPERSSGA